MRFVAEPAFVLHARAWRETSLLVEVLSAEHGRIGLVARGVQGPKKHVLRAALQPLQSIRFDAVQRGELAQLTTAEAVDAAPLLHGDAAMAAFYINELCLRLAPRHDPQPELHATYAQVRERLRAGEPLAWSLRRFERDLLEALEVRIAIESEAAALAARRRTPEQLAAIRAACDAMDAALARGEETTSLDLAFHRAISEATGNRHFVGLFNYLGEVLMARARLSISG